MNPNNQRVIETAEPFLFPGDETGCLLVHGFTGTPKEMRLLGERLHTQGFTVMGVRLAGHATVPADMIRTRWEDWLLSVEDGIHMLRCCCRKIFVLGLSMGGILSIISASRFSVDGLVVMSTPYRLPEDWRLNFIGLFKHIVPEIAKGESDWADPSNAKGHISYAKYPSVSIAELNKAVRQMHVSAPDVKAPVLLVQSTGDSTVPVEHTQWHYNDIGSTDKEIFIVKNSGHVVTRDSEREIVFEKVIQFINRVSKQ